MQDFIHANGSLFATLTTLSSVLTSIILSYWLCSAAIHHVQLLFFTIFQSTPVKFYNPLQIQGGFNCKFISLMEQRGTTSFYNATPATICHNIMRSDPFVLIAKSPLGMFLNTHLPTCSFESPISTENITHISDLNKFVAN